MICVYTIVVVFGTNSHVLLRQVALDGRMRIFSGDILIYVCICNYSFSFFSFIPLLHIRVRRHAVLMNCGSCACVRVCVIGRLCSLPAGDVFIGPLFNSTYFGSICICQGLHVLQMNKVVGIPFTFSVIVCVCVQMLASVHTEVK